MLSEETTARYLDRIGVDPDEITVDLAGLSRLAWAHLTSVPFTNLDVHDRRPVTTSLDWSLPAVLDGRGGWCFVLNGAFGALLETLGFHVTRLGALVVMAADPAPMDDHLCLAVDLGPAGRHLVDVGFGESFTRPLPFPDLDIGETGDPVHDVGAGRRYRLHRGLDGRYEYHSERAGRDGADPHWRVDYRFADEPRDLDYFTPANEHLRLTPGNTWTGDRFATRLTDTGRVTLLEGRIKHTLLHGDDFEQELGDEHQWQAARRRHLPTPG